MRKIVDLSHPLENGQPNFPLDPQIRVTPCHSIAKIGYNLTELSLSTHQGTHLDAPYHFFDDGMTVDSIDLNRLIGPATLIDFAPGGFLETGTPLTLPMFQAHEQAFQPGARIVYRTGWDRMFGKPLFFTGFPTLTLDAARWIAARKISMLGMDTPTPSNEWLECHQILLAKGTEIIIVEGLTRLDQLSTQFTFVGLPLNIKGRDGSPIRAAGILE